MEIANRNGIPVIILCERMKLEQRKVSRLLQGNSAVVCIITYDTEKEVLLTKEPTKESQAGKKIREILDQKETQI